MNKETNNQRRQIVFVSTIHRMTERFITVAEVLSKTYDIILVRCGQASCNTNFEANNHFNNFVNNCNYFRKIIDSPGIKTYNEIKSNAYKVNVQRTYDSLNLELVDCVIYDDSRDFAYESYLTNMCHKLGIPTIANTHGNTSYKNVMSHLCKRGEKHFDHMFLFGKDDLERINGDRNRFLLGGIPANDELKNVNRKKSHILVVVCYALSNQAILTIESGRIRFYNRGVLDAMKLKELQDKFEVPIVFKLKHRINENMMNTIKIFRKEVPANLNYKIIIDHENENDMISSSACVLSYGSTMMFKCIQLGIPTAIFRELGFVGNFDKYYNTMNLKNFDPDVFDEDRNEERLEFLKNSLEGGLNFTSTKSYVDEVMSVIEGKKK